MAVVSHKSVISPVLIGRTHDLEALEGLLAQSRQGHGQLALLVGEAGIGKSRLAAEVKHKASAAGFWTLQGHCVEPDHLIPYAPLLEILRHHLDDPATVGIVQRLGTAAATLAKFFPELDWPAVETEAASTPDQEKRLLHHGLARYLIELAAQRPLLLIIEDLHWSDDATLEFLLTLVRRLVDQPIFLLLTYRGNEIGAGLSRFLAEVERQRVGVELVLAPLTTLQVDEMMRAIFDLARPVRGEFLLAVSELTEGNPFFIEEVLKALLAVGDIFYSDSAWDRRPMAELRIPRTVSDAVQRRAGNLSTPAQQLLSLAAVAGRRFDVAVLQAVTQQDDHTLLAALKELVAAQLIVEAGADEFTFRHALTQQALYGNLLVRERQAMHRALAQTLAQRHLETQPENIDTILPELAYHYHAGGAWAEALLYTRRAGDQAQQLYLPQAAIQQYSRALEAASHLSPSSISATELAALYRARGLAYDMVGHFDQAHADLQEALTLARATPDQQATCVPWFFAPDGGKPGVTMQMEWQALIDLGFLWASRDYGRTGDYYQQALALAERLEEPSVLAHSYNRVGNWQLNRGEERAALHAYQQALAIFETLQDRRGLAQTYDLMGMASGQLGDPQSIIYYERAAASFRELDDRVGLVSVLSMLGPLRTILGGVEEVRESIARADAEVAEALALAQRIGFQSGEIFLRSEYANVLSWRGDYRGAFAHVQRSVDLAQEIEHFQWLGAGYLVLGGIYLDLMAYDQARPYLEQALAMADELGSHIFFQIASSCLVLLYLDIGEADRAEAVLARLSTTAPVNYHDHLCLIARCRLALWRNQPALALSLFEQSRPAFGGSNQGHWISIGLQLIRGEALAALGDPEAEEVLRHVCEVARRVGTRPLLWRGQIALGKYLLGKKRLDEAEREFVLARVLIEELAAGIEDAEIQATFRQRALAMIPAHLSPTPRQVAKRAFDGLTAAEQQVAALVAQGKSNREIATAQVVSIKTVEAHISRILSKLNFTSRAQIAVWAVEKGLSSREGDV